MGPVGLLARHVGLGRGEQAFRLGQKLHGPLDKAEVDAAQGVEQPRNLLAVCLADDHLGGLDQIGHRTRLEFAHPRCVVQKTQVRGRSPRRDEQSNDLLEVSDELRLVEARIQKLGDFSLKGAEFIDDRLQLRPEPLLRNGT